MNFIKFNDYIKVTKIIGIFCWASILLSTEVLLQIELSDPKKN